MKTSEQADVEKLSQIWKQAAESLGVRVETPYLLRSPAGAEAVCVAYLPDFGSPDGIAVGLSRKPLYAGDNVLKELAEEKRIAYSFLNFDAYDRYQEERFKETLIDWGFFGEEARRPVWLPKPEKITQTCRSNSAGTAIVNPQQLANKYSDGIITEWHVERKADAIILGIALANAVFDIVTDEALISLSLQVLESPHKGTVHTQIGRFGGFPITLNVADEDTVSIFIDGPDFASTRTQCAAVWIEKEKLRAILQQILIVTSGDYRF